MSAFVQSPRAAALGFTVDPAAPFDRPDYLLKAARAAARKLAERHELSASDQDEIVSDVCLQVIAKHRQGWAWSRRAVRLYAAQAYRWLVVRWREVATDESLLPEEPIADLGSAVLDLRTLQQAWPLLSPRQRAAMTLRLQGETLDEIGGALGGDKNSINALLVHARKVIDGRKGPRSAVQQELRAQSAVCRQCDRPLPALATGHRAYGVRLYCTKRCESAARRARDILKEVACAAE